MNLRQQAFNFVAALDNASPDDLYDARVMSHQSAKDNEVHAHSRALFGHIADALYKCMSRADWQEVAKRRDAKGG